MIGLLTEWPSTMIGLPLGLAVTCGSSVNSSGSPTGIDVCSVCGLSNVGIDA